MTSRLEDLEAVYAAAEAMFADVGAEMSIPWSAIDKVIACKLALDAAKANAAKRAAATEPLPGGSDPTCDCPACRLGRGLTPLTRKEIEAKLAADGAGGEGGEGA